MCLFLRSHIIPAHVEMMGLFGAGTLNTVTRRLYNRKYIGEYQYRDVEIPNGIPAIVPVKLFESVQERAAANKKAPAKHKAEEEYLLTTKLFCGYCGCLMTGESGTSHTQELYRYYKCRGARNGGGCTKKTVRKYWIEEVVMQLIQKFISRQVFDPCYPHQTVEIRT